MKIKQVMILQQRMCCLPLLLLLLVIQDLEAVATASDLGTDKRALLDFASSFGQRLHGHGRRRQLGWSKKVAMCRGWVGVKCSWSPADGGGGGRVVALELPGFRLHGSIPGRAMARLDALQTLRLENNSLTGPTPPALPKSLSRLNLSNNHLSGPIPPPLLQRFPPSSFAGNPLLRRNHHLRIIMYKEPPPHRPLGRRRRRRRMSSSRRTTLRNLAIAKLVFASIGLVICMALLCFGVLVCCHNKCHCWRRYKARNAGAAPAPAPHN
ncbi:unnamed protein product [Cuscuta epithymum]|uniref:Leucine-rich repeat-containing N-terminal plant-type domain-containing protein n=1 Tax=Cuscuta epithymum TaxID=186058 RepID=A0AAV0C508_9ASTE|nr:unnamed protein product [Cuscuta epithymum]